MKTIVDFMIAPIGVGVSVSKYVAQCLDIIDRSGLTYQLHANGTNLEGDWDAVMGVIKECHEKLHEQRVPRIHTELRIGTRVDRSQSMNDKINSVRAKQK